MSRSSLLASSAAQLDRLCQNDEPLDPLAHVDGERNAQHVVLDPRVQEAIALLSRVAPTNLTVLVIVLGESGSGKETAAESRIQLVRLPATDLPPAPIVEPAADQPSDVRCEVRAFERERILAALRRTGGNQTEAAKLLGVSRRTLTNKLNAHGLPRPRKRAKEQLRP